MTGARRSPTIQRFQKAHVNDSKIMKQALGEKKEPPVNVTGACFLRAKVRARFWTPKQVKLDAPIFGWSVHVEATVVIGGSLGGGDPP